MKEFESDWELLKAGTMSDATRRNWEADTIFPALFGELLDLAGIRINTQTVLSNPRKKHGVISLLGRFKNEIGEKHHLMSVPLYTDSGLKPVTWIGRMLEWCKEGGIENGPVFRDKRGECARYKDFKYRFLRRLARVKSSNPALFTKPQCNVFNDFSLGRSGRRSATGRALNVRLEKTVINTNNRWRVKERAKGSDPNQNMIQHYADVLVILDARLAFPQAM
jgi:hypothetical protein